MEYITQTAERGRGEGIREYLTVGTTHANMMPQEYARNTQRCRNDSTQMPTHGCHNDATLMPQTGYCHAPTRPLWSFGVINVFFVDHAKFQKKHALLIVLFGRGVAWSDLQAP